MQSVRYRLLISGRYGFWRPGVLRVDFRTFRLDRIEDFEVLEERFRPERGKTLVDFLKRPATWTRSSLTAASDGGF